MPRLQVQPQRGQYMRILVCWSCDLRILKEAALGFVRTFAIHTYVKTLRAQQPRQSGCFATCKLQHLPCMHCSSLPAAVGVCDANYFRHSPARSNRQSLAFSGAERQHAACPSIAARIVDGHQTVMSHEHVVHLEERVKSAFAFEGFASARRFDFSRGILHEQATL